MNPYNGTCGDRGEGVCLDQLVGLDPVPYRVTAFEPDLSFKLTYNFHTFTTEDLSLPGEYVRYFGEWILKVFGLLCSHE
jgi:hypothetical protein